MGSFRVAKKGQSNAGGTAVLCVRNSAAPGDAGHTYDKGYKRWEEFDIDAALSDADAASATTPSASATTAPGDAAAVSAAAAARDAPPRPRVADEPRDAETARLARASSLFAKKLYQINDRPSVRFTYAWAYRDEILRAALLFPAGNSKGKARRLSASWATRASRGATTRARSRRTRSASA